MLTLGSILKTENQVHPGQICARMLSLSGSRLAHRQKAIFWEMWKRLGRSSMLWL
jgi:hypothetical protein